MFDELMISGDALVLSSGGLAVAVRLPWYRSLPLSCVTGVRARLDGGEVPTERLCLRLYGSDHSIEELPTLHEVSWFVLDEAELRLHLDPGELAGSHDLELALELRIPYPEYGARSFTQVARCSKTLVLEGADA